MKLLKPLALSVLTGPYERKGRVHLAVVVAAMTSFDGEVLENEQTIWKTLASTPGFSGILDELKPKTKPEFWALGWAFAPEGRKVAARSVKIEFGTFVKELWVVGDRVWRGGVASDPVPFEKMPVDWEHAYGGEAYAPNPLGRGFAAVKTESGQTVHVLPNVEWPKKLVTSPGDRPAPAGFGVIDPSWSKRMSKLGTYDKRWLETRYPDYPDDFDPTYFNMAPEDQWLDKLEGGERVVIERMHPTKERIEGKVPSFVVRAFVSRTDDELRDVPLRLDTVILVPHVERLVLVYRAFIEVTDDEASDVSDLMVAVERPREAKGMSHYRDVRAKRLDRDKGALYALKDKDLIPDGMRSGSTASDDEYAKLLEREGLVERAMKNRAETQVEQVREELRRAGIDPDKHVPRDSTAVEAPKPPDMNTLADFIETTEKQAQEAIRASEEQQKKALSDARRICEENGLDFDKLVADAKREQGGPPKFKARAEMERLHDLAVLSANAGMGIPELTQLATPDLEQRFLEAQKALEEAYRRHVHYLPRAFEMDAEHAARVRLEVEALIINNESLADLDFTGANLSGLDFSGCDLSRSFLEAARLEGCKFVGAKLERTVLARANLTGATFTKARLTGANLGEADCTNASFDGGADATEAVFYRTDLRGANLRGIVLDRADLNEAKVEGADFSGAVATELTILRSDFRGAKFEGAKITKSNLLDLDITGVDFRRCNLNGTVFLDVIALGANFDDAQLESLRVVCVDRGASLDGATFRRTNLRGSFFRAARLQKADFSDALLDAADFSKCDLTDATFEGARMRECRLMKANLTRTNFDHTDLFQALMGGTNVRGAHFEEASLFRVDGMGMVGDDKTSFRGANVNFVRRAPR